MGDHEWAEFTTNLAGVLHRCPVDSILILNAGERFMDFSPGVSSSGNDLCVQVCDNITEAGRQFLHDNGWRAPDANDFNWCGEYRNPSTADYHGIAEAAVEVLREVFAVTSPTEIHPDGWLDGRADFELPIDQLRSTPSSEIASELQPLIPIAEALLTDSPWLVPTVRYILAAPEQDRGLGPWQRFLNALGDTCGGGLGLLAEFYWKQDADRVRDILQHLPSHPALSWDWFPDFAASTTDWHSGDIIEVLLDRVGADCRNLGFALVSFDTDSDVYAVTFVPLDQVDQLRVVTAATGHRMSVWQPS
ncbi:DUF6630 family protein [Nocardia tengchongensis]|uniref:DUF6630 family protein n=1 Tax=Nocardia tengchongensis TaxID=2055889 RepID=UPI00367A5A8D